MEPPKGVREWSSRMAKALGGSPVSRMGRGGDEGGRRATGHVVFALPGFNRICVAIGLKILCRGTEWLQELLQ